MSPMSSSPVVLFSLFLLLLSAADAFNITQILSQFPDFTTFNNYLIHTGVAGAINSKQTVTVLVVANGNMSEVSALSPDALKKTLSVHVILDYFDAGKLKNLQANKTLTITTLYQESGQSQNQQGFLNMTHVGNGGVAFGSAAPGSNMDSVFIKPISSQPYNVSVLQISNVIKLSSSNSTTRSPPPAHAPAASPTTPPHPPTASPPRKVLAPAPSPMISPPANASAPSVAPAADTPGGSPSNPVADSPGAADDKSFAVSITSGNHLAAILMILSSAWFLLTMI